VEKQVLGFCAAIEHKLLLLLSKCFEVFHFVLLVNDVFILFFCAAQEYPSLDKNRDYSDTERTRNELPLQKIKLFVLLWT
jgi:hypothetical protein